MRLIASFLALFLIVMAPAVAAAAIDDAGAAALKKELEMALQMYTVNTRAGDQGLSLSGPVTVVPKKDFYEATLPGAKVLGPVSNLIIGNIVMNATPGKDGEYLASVALPGKIQLVDSKTSETMMEINLGNQKFAGAWYPALGTFPKVDAEYKNITVTGSSKKAFTGKVDTIKAVLDLSKNPDNTWSGKQTGLVEGVKMTIPPEEGAVGENFFTMARSTVDATYDKMDLARAQKMREKVRELYKDGQNPAPEKVKALLGEILSTSDGGILGGTTSKVDAKDMTLHIQLGGKKVKPPEPVVLKLAHVTSAVAVSGLRDEFGNGNAKMKFDGLSAAGISEKAKGLIPATGTFEIDGVKIPVRDISRTLTTLIGKTMNADLPALGATQEQREAAIRENQEGVMRATNEILTLLQKAGSVLSIRNTELKARDITAAINGEARVIGPTPPATDPVGTGMIAYTLEGLDELVAKGAGEKPDPESADATYQQALTFLQMMGQQSKAPSGKSLRTYKFELTPQGQFTLNGAPMGAIGQMLKTFRQQ